VRLHTRKKSPSARFALKKWILGEKKEGGFSTGRGRTKLGRKGGVYPKSRKEESPCEVLENPENLRKKKEKGFLDTVGKKTNSSPP